MSFRAIHRFARISPRKTRLVIDLIRGKSANDALRIMQSLNKRACPMVRRVLTSAIANATSQEQANANELYVKEARVDGGPILKRFRPGPMGRAMRIRKRTAHIVITLGVKTTQAKADSAKTESQQPGKQ